MGNLGIPVDMIFGQGNYVDRGCRVEPSCLRCSLERCIFEDGVGGAFHESFRRRDEAVRARRGRATSEETAAQFHISKRTVYRLWQGAGQ